MMLARLLLWGVIAAAIILPAQAAELINSFDVTIEVKRSGDISVTEKITVTSEGNQIRRGIFRDLPRYYTSGGARYPYQYSAISVRRDGEQEPYTKSSSRNQTRIRIGDPEVFLADGLHVYEIAYSVENQVRFFADYDEIYWNVTGNYWAFPIETARATISLPPGAEVTGVEAYTGAFGQSSKAYEYFQNGDMHVFRTTGPLSAREGLTVALGFQKGLIEPPSAADRTAMWWQRNGSMAILLASLLGLFGYYYTSFNRVGRDPAKGPVFPRYAPPDGYSPAAVHHIFHRMVANHKALIATLLNMAVKEAIRIDTDGRKETTLTPAAGDVSRMDCAAEDRELVRQLFAGRSSVILGKKYDKDFTAAYTAFKRQVSAAYGQPYFRWNTVYLILPLILSAIALFFAFTHAAVWSNLHTLGVVALAVLNGWFIYLIPAPTKKGQEIRTEIEGFKLYLETAEKLQLNAVEVGGEAPPPMTTERYEKFLPYAVALGVEEPWTRHFEQLIPEEARNYSPRWTTMHAGRHSSLHGLNKAMIAGMATGVAASLPQSSGSSGSSGGGFSGGGGGGGGGGGW